MCIFASLLVLLAFCGLCAPANAGTAIPCESIISGTGASTGDLTAVAILSGCTMMSEEDAAHNASPELRKVLQQWRSEVFKKKPFFAAHIYRYTLKITNPSCDRRTLYSISAAGTYDNDGVWLYFQDIRSSIITLQPRTSVTLEFLSPLPPEANELHIGEEVMWYNGIWGVQDSGKVKVAVPMIDEPVSDKTLIFFSLPARFGPAGELHSMFGTCEAQ